MVYKFFNEVKHCRGACWQNSSNLGCHSVWSHPGGCHSIPFLLFKDPWHDRGVLWHPSWSSFVVRAVVKVLVVWQVLVLGSGVSFLSANQNENQNIWLNKNNKTLSLHRKSVLCWAGIFPVINDEWQQQQGVKNVFLGSRLEISTPQTNQSGANESGHCSSVVSWPTLNDLFLPVSSV